MHAMGEAGDTPGICAMPKPLILQMTLPIALPGLKLFRHVLRHPLYCSPHRRMLGLLSSRCTTLNLATCCMPSTMFSAQDTALYEKLFELFKTFNHVKEGNKSDFTNSGLSVCR